MASSKVVASIEARMNSSRLPGKVLADIGGQPALTRLLGRLRRASLLDDIVLATSTARADDVLEEWAHNNNVHFYRGSEDDVLGRVVEAHRMLDSDVVVEITGDCVFTDPEVVDLGIETFLGSDCDVLTSAVRDAYPIGTGIDVFRRSLFEQVESEATDPIYREHVALYFYRHPDRFRILHLDAPACWYAPDARLTLDYPEDLALLREIVSILEPSHGRDFGLADVVDLLRRDASILDINRHCVQKIVP